MSNPKTTGRSEYEDKLTKEYRYGHICGTLAAELGVYPLGIMMRFGDWIIDKGYIDGLTSTLSNKTAATILDAVASESFVDPGDT